MLSLARTSQARAAATAKAQVTVRAVACRSVGTQAPWKPQGESQKQRQRYRRSQRESTATEATETEEPRQYRPQTRRIQAKEAAALGGPQHQTAAAATSASRYWPKLETPRHAKKFTHHDLDWPKENGPVSVAWTDKFLFVEDPATENGRRTLKPATLRDSCACPKCRDVSSGQKTFSSVEIPVDVGLEHVKSTKKGLEIKFLNDIPRFVDAKEPHVMLLPWESVDLSLKRKGMEDVSLPRKRSVLRRTGVVYWDRETIAQQVRRIDYAEFMKDDSEAFWDVIIDICRFGLVYLKNVPRDEESVVRITTRIANIRETFYGRTFDVRAKPNAENVAYTSGYLGLHQDLLYLDPPPMIQVLHCMDNSCAGGESLFSDGERVGRLLWPFVTRHRMAPLAEHHVPYQYGKHGYHYFSSRYVLDGNTSGFQNVYWSPPFQGRYLSPVKDIRQWIEPASIFASLINDKDAIHEHKMEAGDCVLFDNLRVLHGRNAFDVEGVEGGGGARWLRGAYIAAEDFLSRAAHIPKGMAEKYRGEEAWTPGLAQNKLKQSVWYEDVVRRVKGLDPGVEA